MKRICDSVGSIELCNGCGAAKPHNPTYCEPCPVNKDAICKEPDAKGVLGLFLLARGIEKDSNSQDIDNDTNYDLYILKTGMTIIEKSIEQPFCQLVGHLTHDKDRRALRQCLRCGENLFFA